MQWIWLKLLTLSVESLSQFKISPFFLSVIWILKSHSLWLSFSFVTFFSMIWSRVGLHVGGPWSTAALDTRTVSLHSGVNWLLEVVSHRSYGVTRQVRAIRSLLSPFASGADFWEHRCMIDDPRQPRYCFHRVKNTSPEHAIIFAADARASTPLHCRRDVSSRLVLVTEHKRNEYLAGIG